MHVDSSNTADIPNEQGTRHFEWPFRPCLRQKSLCATRHTRFGRYGLSGKHCARGLRQTPTKGATATCPQRATHQSYNIRPAIFVFFISYPLPNISRNRCGFQRIRPCLSETDATISNAPRFVASALQYVPTIHPPRQLCFKHKPHLAGTTDAR